MLPARGILQKFLLPRTHKANPGKVKVARIRVVEIKQGYE